MVVIYISFNFDFLTKCDLNIYQKLVSKICQKRDLVHQFRSIVGPICNWNASMFMVK